MTERAGRVAELQHRALLAEASQEHWRDAAVVERQGAGTALLEAACALVVRLRNRLRARSRFVDRVAVDREAAFTAGDSMSRRI